MPITLSSQLTAPWLLAAMVAAAALAVSVQAAQTKEPVVKASPESPPAVPAPKREPVEGAPEAATPLQDLEWLVGQWIDRGPGATIETAVTWTRNKTFLSYTFKASVPGLDDLEGTQVIGWDPAARTIRSWMFDSDGGFGEGTWSQKGNRWIVKFSQVLPDGRKGSATNIYTRVDANTFTWKSIGRKVDGQFLPNIDEVKIVRKTASGGVNASGDGAEPPNKCGEERPRSPQRSSGSPPAVRTR
jgi:hypothetical protein